MATHSSILTWRVPWTDEPHGLQSMGLHRVDMTERTQHACRAGKELWGKTQIPGKLTEERAILDGGFRGGFFLDVVFQQRHE